MKIPAKSIQTAAWTVYRCQFGYYKVIGFGSGPCKKCKKCNPQYCNFPDKTVPAMEACGIDVFATVRNNGLEIYILREKGEIQNHFGLLMVE